MSEILGLVVDPTTCGPGGPCNALRGALRNGTAYRYGVKLYGANGTRLSDCWWCGKENLSPGLMADWPWDELEPQRSEPQADGG